MKVLIGISHPKQVYMFKNLINTLERNGHQYSVVVNDKEITSQLLSCFGIKFTKIGKNKAGILNKVIQLIILTFKTIIISLKFKPDIYVGQAIPHLGFSSYIMRKSFVIFEDTDNSKLLQRIVNPFATAIVTPSSFRKIDKSLVKINGGFELAYLHPNNFLPNKDLLKELKLNENEKFVILRFVSWNANHDIGQNGISEENKILAVNEFSKIARVFISSESILPDELAKYKFPLKPEHMHSAIFYSSLVYGESGSMTAEASYLGTPSIFLNNLGLGYTDSLEHNFGLVYNYNESKEDQIKSIRKGVEILKTNDDKVFSDRRKALLDSSIDVNKFMYWFVTEFPASHSTMKKDPNSQYNFK
jgi:uncharacterized protein